MGGAETSTIEHFTLLSVAILIIIIRIIARATSIGFPNLQLDDYLMPLAAVFYSLETVVGYCANALWHGLANNGMTEEERASILPDSEEYWLRVGGSKTAILGWVSYTTLLWLLKLCMAIFYSRLTSGLVNMKIRVQIAYASIGVTYVMIILAVLLGCHPFYKNWQIYPDPGRSCQPMASNINLLLTQILNIATDLYLIAIPLPIIFQVRLPIYEKLQLMFLFSGGIFIMACGIIRTVYIYVAGEYGPREAGNWAPRESFVAVVLSNVPLIYPLFRRVVCHAISYISGRGDGMDQSHPSGSAPVPEGTISQASKKKPRLRHPLSLPDTQWHDEATLCTAQQSATRSTAWHESSGRRSAEVEIKVTQETIIEMN